MAQHDTTNARPSLNELREVVADVAGVDPASIGDDANLLDLGLDSLAMLRLMNRIRRTGVRVSAQDLAAEPTLTAWHRHISTAPARTRPS